MCALFGYLDYGHIVPTVMLTQLVQLLGKASEVRGTHASGIAYNRGSDLVIYKRPKPAHRMKFKLPTDTNAVMGHTRFTTQGSQKRNQNNHPFRGHAGTEFALAHNGVLYNDHELRITEDLPQTDIETDSYIAVQLLEKRGDLSMESLRFMAEKICGSFTFTLLDRDNYMYFVKGDSPLHLIHFPSLGLYIYASTKQIMDEALSKTALRFVRHEVVNVKDGEIVKLTKDGIITRETFQMQNDYLPRRCWYPSMMRHFDCEDDAFADLLDICGCYGVTEEEIMYLRECGFTFDEIEEYLFDPTCIWDNEEVGVEL